MGSGKLPTDFAPAERATPEALERQAQVFAALEMLREFLDASPYGAVVLNAERQIVFANRALADLAGVEDERRLLGARPGEALNCIHWGDGPGKCGTSEFCGNCGAVNAILAAQKGLRDARECRITRRDGAEEKALDLLVSTSPVVIAAQPFVICTLVDISHEKRRRALERIFFHDILSAAGGIQGLAAALADIVRSDDGSECVRLLSTTSRRLIAEIRSQQQLLAAESRELAVAPSRVDTLPLLRSLSEQYASYDMAQGRAIHIDPVSEDVEIATDPSLLSRVLENMLKNALEASVPGETVAMGCRASGEQVEFWVHNDAVMPREVQLQVFQRSFSTKGPARGLGAYSMKLLSEQYLGGRVEFRSAEGQGTTFLARFPKLLPF